MRTHPVVKNTVAAAIIALLISGATVNAAVPQLIRYQGFLKDSAGAPLHGPYQLTFRLYGASTGGNALWTEPQSAVEISEGSFSVLLGQVTSLATIDWSTNLWLSIQVESAAELSPRQQITSVPLALRAAVAEGLTTPVTTSNITDDANRLVPTGAIILWMQATCPAGYSRVTSMDGRFLVAESSFNAAAGGSNTKDISHNHSMPSHSHGNTSVQCMGWNAGPGGPGVCGSTNAVVGSYFQDQQSQSGGSGQTGSAGNSSLDIRPAFATVLLCQKD